MAPAQPIVKIRQRTAMHINSGCLYQWESRDSSATRIFFLKKKDDATSDPETNHQVLASSLISFSWKKYRNFGPKTIVKCIIN